MSAETAQNAYDVVVNEEEQYSIWPSGRDLPAGWRVVGVSGSKEECLAHIREVWIDITPLSVRRRLAEARSAGAPR
jgi:MbtH protein